MSIDEHRTDEIYAVIRSLVASGTPSFRPGHIADALREAGDPLLSWEIRGELARLESRGLISVDPATGAYSLTEAARKAG